MFCSNSYLPPSSPASPTHTGLWWRAAACGWYGKTSEPCIIPTGAAWIYGKELCGVYFYYFTFPPYKIAENQQLCCCQASKPQSKRRSSKLFLTFPPHFLSAQTTRKNVRPDPAESVSTAVPKTAVVGRRLGPGRWWVSEEAPSPNYLQARPFAIPGPPGNASLSTFLARWNSYLSGKRLRAENGRHKTSLKQAQCVSSDAARRGSISD